MTAEAFTPIPDCPGYRINPRGQVLGKRGLLTHDSQGCVNLRMDGKLKKMFPGELLLLVGWRRQAETKTEEAAAARIEELEEQCRKAEAEADFVRSRADGLEAEVKKARLRADGLEARCADAALQSVDAGKKKSAVRPTESGEDVQTLKARCKAAEGLAKKFEAQRDNLAAKLLAMQAKLAEAKIRGKQAFHRSGGRSMAGGFAGGFAEDEE